ncbi:MAG TPA: SGNH/GDSL hydrolase family protein [Propionibacteriaceae bacterium]|nr:SGNH/GDSL hydrolase family protein [Propionibacteriaceae bacterium]
MWNKAVLGLFGGLTLALATSLATTADAAPKPSATATVTSRYVALGDSYAAGVGAGSYVSDGTSCRRSLLGYGGLIAANNGFALNLQACSGAVTGDVLTKQLGAVTADTNYVTISIGGNDIGFASVLTTCLGTNTTACLNAITAAETKATNELPAKLDAVFGGARGKAPAATIVATNYPRLFNGKDCSLLTSFTSTEMTRLNAGADTLSGVISAAATRAKITFSDVRTPFVGHAVCASTPWIRNASLFTQYESFHPNATGYKSGYNPPVAASLGVSATKVVTTTSTVTTGGQTSSDTTRGVVKVSK